jgi:hypothetical protein
LQPYPSALGRDVDRDPLDPEGAGRSIAAPRGP